MSNLTNFSLAFKETFPTFPSRTYILEIASYFEQNDTRTIAILGTGRRTDVLVRSARGDGSEGSPQDFNPLLAPTGRHFAVSTFPIDPTTFQVYRGINGALQLTASEFFLDEANGYFVLFHPLTRGESLVISYISFSDVNHVRGYLKDQLQDLYLAYGEPSLINTISAASQIAFANGAARIIVVQGDHTGRDPYWFEAYQALATQRPWMVVPIQNGYYGNLIAAGLEHVQEMSETPHRRERYLLVGELNADPASGDYVPRSVASDFNREERISFIGCDDPVTILQGETAATGGGFLAAAVAGLWSSYEYIPQPLTNKNIVAITPTWPKPDLYSQQQLNQLVSDGVSLIVLKGGVGAMHQFTTTLANGNPVDLEPSIWRIRDYVAIALRSVLENRYVGRPLVIKDILPAISDTITQQLQAMVDQNILTKFASVSVRVDDIEPRQVNVSFDAEPVFPLNKINIPFRVVSSL